MSSLNADSAVTPPASRRLAVNAAWFARLRWVAAAGQLVTIAVASGALGIALPVGALLVLVGVTVVSNIAFLAWSARRVARGAAPEATLTVLGGLMALDLVVLTAMLALSGGPTNPFVVFFFVNLALSGVVLPARRAWLLGGLAVAAYALLIFTHRGVDVLQDPARLRSVAALRAAGAAGPPLAVVAEGVAFAAAAAVIIIFTTRLTSELRISERLRRRAEERRAKAEKLEALGTLAAGAAHELATPLTTIAVVTGETARALERLGAPDDALADVELVKRELARCRAILDRMGAETGLARAGAPERLTAGDLVAEVLAGLAAADRVDAQWLGGAERLTLVAPRVGLAQALRAVVQNAVDASAEMDPPPRVLVRCDPLADTLRLAVIDRGPGISPDALRRAGEPFFTTKPPGRGMGLGLYLTRSVVERLGGSVRLESSPEGGTVATVVLPVGR